MFIKTEKSRRIVVLLMFLMFSIPMGTTLVSSLFSASESGPDAVQAAVEAQTRIVEAEAGYEIVLEREPDNITALDGLLQLRLAHNDWEGAKVPLNKLITLQPNNEAYSSLLEEVEAQLATATQNNSDLD